MIAGRTESFRQPPADCDNSHDQRLDLHLLEQSPLQGHAQMNEEGLAVMEASPVSVSAHVLAVDDDPSVRQMIVDYLGDNDIRVTALSSGQQISENLARDTIDLVVLDLRLPGEDGMQIARKLRDESAGLPVIMLTGRKDQADRVMGL